MPDQNIDTESKSASRPADPPMQSSVDEPVSTPERAAIGDETEFPVPSAAAPDHDPAAVGAMPTADGYEAAVDSEEAAAEGDTSAVDGEAPAVEEEAGEAELDRAAVVEGEPESDRDADRAGRDVEPAAEPEAAADQFDAEADRPSALVEPSESEPDPAETLTDREAETLTDREAETPTDRESEDASESVVAAAQSDGDESRVDGAEFAPAGASTAPDQDAAPAELAPGDLPVPQPVALWSGEDTEAVRERWRQLQSRFVDDPHGAAAAADDLIGETVESLTAALMTQRQQLGAWRSGGEFDTEQLRVAVTGYRDFLERVLSI